MKHSIVGFLLLFAVSSEAFALAWSSPPPASVSAGQSYGLGAHHTPGVPSVTVYIFKNGTLVSSASGNYGIGTSYSSPGDSGPQTITYRAEGYSNQGWVAPLTAYTTVVAPNPTVTGITTNIGTVIRPGNVFKPRVSATAGVPLHSIHIYTGPPDSNYESHTNAQFFGAVSGTSATMDGNNVWAGPPGTTYTFYARCETQPPYVHSPSYGPVTFTVVNSPPDASLDTVSYGNGWITGNGWAADPDYGAPVNRVEIYLDGIHKQNASLGGDRSDVSNAYGRSDYRYSGTNFSFSSAGVALGAHTVLARAFDNHGGYTDRTKTVDVTNSTPTVAMTINGVTATGSTSNATTVSNGTTITVNTSASDVDGNFQRIRVWSNYNGQGWVEIRNVTASSDSFSYTLNGIGTWQIHCRSMDSNGAESGTAIIDVTSSNHPPVVAMTANGVGTATITFGQSVTISATGTDPDGNLYYVDWMRHDGQYYRPGNADMSRIGWNGYPADGPYYSSQNFTNDVASGSGPVIKSAVFTPPSAGTFSFLGYAGDTLTNAGAWAYVIVNPAGQTINFPQPPTQVFGTPLDLDATASSGLPVSYQIISGPATVSGDIVTFTGVGEVTVRATQGGSANYHPASSVDRTFMVNRMPTTFSFSNLVHTYNGDPKSASVHRSPANATYSADLSKGPNVGQYTVSATATGNFTGTGSDTLYINPASQEIQNFPQPDPQVYGTPLTLGATATSGLPVSYTIVYGPATVADNIVTFTGPGEVKVRASQGGNSNYSAAPSLERTFAVNDTAAPIFTGPAGAPEVLAIGSAGLQMKWQATDNVGVVRYDVAISTGGPTLGSWSQTVTSATVSSYTHTFAGLSPATSYTISVTIFDQAGNSASGQWSVSTCPLDVPPTPGYFIFDITTNSVVATWAECEENMSLDYYNIQVETVTVVNGSPSYQLIHSSSVNATPTPGVLTPVSFSSAAVSLGLTEATRYRVSVQAIDSGGHHSAWGREEFTTLDVTPPGVPSGLTHDSLTQTGLRLIWDAVTDNSNVVRYEVHQNVPGTGWVPIHLSISGTAQVIGNLTPGTEYSFAVRARDAAVNAAGTSAPNYSTLSAPHNVTTAPPTPIVTSPSTWSVPQNAHVYPYQIAAQHNPTSFGVSGTLPVGLSFNPTLGRISGVPTQPGISTVTVAATNAGGTGQKSLSVTVVANGLVAGAAVNSGVSANWFNGHLYIKPTQTVSLVPSGSALSPFVIDWVDHEVVRPNASMAYPVQTNPNEPFFPLAYLPDGSEGLYTYRVRVVDTAGDFIEATANFTVDATAPTVVTNFGVASGAAQARSVTLSWNASSDINGVANYRIQGAALGANPIVTSGLAATVSNLQPGTNYSFTIISTDAAGNSSTAATANVTTLVEITSPGTWSISSGSVEGFSLLTNGSASSYSVVTGTLPPGLSLNPTTGILTGSATTPGTYTFSLGAHNSGGTATQPFTIVVNPATAPSGTPISFEIAEGFTAGSLINQLNWAVPHGAAAVSATSTHSGSTAVELHGGAVRPEITRSYTSNPAESVTFVDLHARPAANVTIADSTIVELDAARVGFKKVGSDAIIQGYDGVVNDWRTSGAMRSAATDGTTSDWIRLTVRLDYATKMWDLYVDGQVQLFDLAFADPTLTAFNVFKLRGAAAGTTFIDDVLVSFDNPLFADADKDGIPDDWEIAHGMNPNLSDRALDTDDDGLTNFEEYLLGTDPGNPDTDGDGIKDGQEIALGLDPIAPDGFWNVHDLTGETVPAGADFLIIDGEGGVHGVTKSNLIIKAQ